MRVAIAFLLIGVLSLDLSFGLIAPLNHPKGHIEKYGKRIGPHYFEEEMQKLWDSHTVSDSSEKFVTEAPPPQFQTSRLFNKCTIVGKTMKTDVQNRTIYAWEGFRYGKPIDRQTRFKPATREDNVFWTGDTFHATQMGFKCPQEPMIGSQPSGRADCLYLNIFTPWIPKTENAKNLPVMFFVHGGGFVMGDASMYLPTKLLNHDVILVTIHYRLGAQGFWTLQNDDAPGNQALYDQVLALNWVYDNIEEFGGNPNKITVFGESAGSVSVNYLLISELSRGKISGVIAESGSALDNWALDLDPRYATLFIANECGCNTTDATDKEIFECMLDVPDSVLTRAESHLISSDRKSGLVGFRGAAPIIQSAETVTLWDLIVTKHPREYFLQGDFNDVPFMTGANRNEGSYVFSVMYFDFMLPNDLVENGTWLKEESTQQILRGIGAVDETYSLANHMDEKYCPGIDRSNFNDSIQCMIDMNGAIFLKAGSWQTCKYHTYFSSHNAYYYSFDYTSEDTMYTWIGGPVYWDTGVTHSDELMYLFTMPYPMDGDQIRIEQIMTLLWTNFATYGDPTPDEYPVEWKNMNIPKWKPYTYGDPHYLLIENAALSVNQEYSERWTFSSNIAWPSTTPPSTETPTTKNPCGDIQQKSDAYEAAMIVFVVAFVIVFGITIYFFFKARK